MRERLSFVLTTIQQPTAAVRAFDVALARHGARMIVAGDRKGPRDFELDGATFLSLEKQRSSGFALAAVLPEAHYARKNIGYLDAIREGAACIYETDDDNAPLPVWAPRSLEVDAVTVGRPGEWVNVYSAFTSEHIWPRGLPLDAIGSACRVDSRAGIRETASAPIQQGLANGSPDVDAVWRLVLDRPFTFDVGPSVRLAPGTWCPFNSQSTWWWPDAFPLLYLPSYCSFRMTDIWRSLVAQRCLWALGHGIVFHAAEVMQDRNEHDLMRDFEHEVPGYLRNREIASVLRGLELESGKDAVGSNLRRCYEALVPCDLFPATELALVNAWLTDLETIAS